MFLKIFSLILCIFTHKAKKRTGASAPVLQALIEIAFAVEEFDQRINVFIQLRHVLGKVVISLGIMVTGHDSLIGIGRGGMDVGIQGVIIDVLEVQPTDAPSLDVRDMVLISFMGLTQQLKAIDEYLVREDFKHTILKNNNF